MIRYGVESLSMTGRPGDRFDTSMNQLHLLFEQIIVSLHNMTERLHHSFWFYIMTSAKDFILLSFYIVGLVAAFLGPVFEVFTFWIVASNVYDSFSINGLIPQRTFGRNTPKTVRVSSMANSI